MARCAQQSFVYPELLVYNTRPEIHIRSGVSCLPILPVDEPALPAALPKMQLLLLNLWAGIYVYIYAE